MPTRKQFLTAMAAAAIRAKSALGAPKILAALAGGQASWEVSGNFFKIVITSDARGIWIGRFLLGDLPDNLACEDVGSGLGRSCTGLLPVDGRWWFSALPPSGTVFAEGGRIQVSGVLLGPPSEPIAREDWSLSIGDDSLLWQIERTYLREVRLVADRFPALVLRPRAGGRFFEAPGFLDLGMRLDGPSMFPLHAPDVERYEAISPRRVQTLRFAPSGIALESTLTTGFFSFAKPNRDSTAPDLALGAETVDRTKGPELRAAGFRQAQAWTLRKSHAPGLPFELALPDRFLTEQSRSFAAVHNQWMGWLFGNNPASTPVLQEMGWFPMIQGIFPKNPETLAALEKELLFFADQGVDPQGFVLPRWAAAGFYRARWGEMVDQIPMFILAMYYHVLNSGDRDFARRVMPTLDRVYRSMMALDTDHDGVFEVPGSGLADGGRHCSGWYDIVNFGHKDALINAWCVGALEALAQLAAFIGDAVGSARYSTAHQRSVEAYNRIFWDEAHDLYLDWIDVREQMPESGRRYFYTDQNMAAIIFGIADNAKARRILAHLDRRYDALCQEFHLSRDAIYATPANMYPVSRTGDLVDFGKRDNQAVYPHYENGCSFFHSTGLEIAARGIAGQADAAYDSFERVMRCGYARNRLWGAALKWDTGAIVSEPLNNALLILWGFQRGCFGVRPSLTGLRLDGAVAEKLEGATHTFCHLGRDVRVQVQDGRCVLK